MPIPAPDTDPRDELIGRLAVILGVADAGRRAASYDALISAAQRAVGTLPPTSSPAAGDVVALVPDAEGVRALADLEGVHPVRYDPHAPLPPEAAHATVLVAGAVSPGDTIALLDSCPRVELVQVLSAGAEAWLGRLPEGVALADCEGAHGGAAAEWAVAALLALLRELPGFVRDQDARRWDRHGTDTLMGKRVLLVGAGDVAEQTALRLAPFGVQLVTRVGRRARASVHAAAELPELLPHHDVVMLLVPLTDETRGMVGADFLAAMPDGAVLVNAARGSVVDTDALLAELGAHRIRAAVDVTDPEPPSVEHPLWSAPGLLLTPHVGGSVPGFLERAYQVVRAQLAAVARGEDPPNLVTGQY